jgi:site-specific DNA recombinase
MNKHMAVGYCRVSTDDQADVGLSLDYQEEQCRNTAIREGYLDSEIIIVRDEGKSGTNLSRAGIQSVIELAKKKAISRVYVTHSDRLARSVLDHAFLRTTFTSNNVKLSYLNGQSSAEDACSVMTDNMFATINQYHSDNTREKTRQATDAKALAGYLPTHAPVGYVNCENPDKNCSKVAKKIIMSDQNTGPLVTEAFKLYATGQYSALELNDKMFEKGLVSGTGKKLTQSMFFHMLKNRMYLGEIHWRHIVVKEGKHDPLTDEATFDKVQSVLLNKLSGRCRRRKYTWLLNGFIFCAIHGYRYTAEWHLKKKIAYYHCRNRGGCGKYCEKTNLENQVAQKFKELEFSQDFIDGIVKKVKDTFEKRKESYLSKYRGLLNQKNAFEAKLKTTENRLIDETITNEVYLRIKNDMDQSIIRVDKQIAGLKQVNTANVDVISKILAFTRNIYKTYIEAPEPLQKHLIGFFFEGFDIQDGVIIRERYTPLFKELLTLKRVLQKSAENGKSFDNNADFEVIISNVLGD